MWLDQNSIAYFQQQVDQRGSVVLEGLPVAPEHFITMTGAPQVSIAVARSSTGSYLVLVPEDLTPRTPALLPYFTGAQTLQGWRILQLPPSQDVGAALSQAGQILGIAPEAEEAVPETAPANPAPLADNAGTVRVPAADEEEEPHQADSGLPFTRDLTQAARRGELSPVHGREKELRQVLTILLQRERNCPLLCGEPGTGKTAIVEKLALLSAEGQLPERLNGLNVMALDLPSLLAESSHKGAVEKNVTRIMDGLMGNPRLLLFADEIHNLIEARGDLSIMEMLKPRLARGLRVIGATTHAEFKQRISGDQALVRRFDVVNVEEPSPEETEAILMARLPILERHHGIRVPPETIPQIVQLAEEHFPNRRRPDKALMLLDRSMAAESLKAQEEAR